MKKSGKCPKCGATGIDIGEHAVSLQLLDINRGGDLVEHGFTPATKYQCRSCGYIELYQGHDEFNRKYRLYHR